MALATARGYPYPESTDPADVPADMYALALAIDEDVTAVASATTAAVDDLRALVLMGAI